MAIDTARKRNAALIEECAVLIPHGSFDTTDRAVQVGQYFGAAITTPPTATLTGSVSGCGRFHTLTYSGTGTGVTLTLVHSGQEDNAGTPGNSNPTDTLVSLTAVNNPGGSTIYTLRAHELLLKQSYTLTVSNGAGTATATVTGGPPFASSICSGTTYVGPGGAAGGALYAYLANLGRVLFLQDGLLTAGELITTPGTPLTYAGPSGASLVSLFGRTWIRPNPTDYPAGSIFTGSIGQLTARYYVSCSQPQNWDPATDGFTFITFALGQYQPNPIGNNTRSYKALAINTRLVDTSTVFWTPHWLLHGQQVENTPGFYERCYTQGASGNVVTYDVTDMFATDNGIWTGNTLGPYRWGWGTVFEPSLSNRYTTFFSHNDGTVEFKSPIFGGSNFSTAWPSDPAIHIFLSGLQGTTHPAGSSSDALVGVNILLPYPLSQTQIQDVFTQLMNGLSMSQGGCSPYSGSLPCGTSWS